MDGAAPSRRFDSARVFKDAGLAALVAFGLLLR
jgi:hypothetical protein